MTVTRDKRSNHFCGPAAISALCGIHVDDAARALRIVAHKASIKGVANRHMVAALENLGHRALPVPLASKRPTLAQVLRGQLRDRDKAQRFLIVLTGHYVTIQGRKLVDNFHPEGIYLGDYSHRRKRVKAIWAVTRTGEVTPPLKPMTCAEFSREVERLGLTTDGSYVDAPKGRTFPCGLHAIAINEYDYRAALADVKSQLPLVECENLPYCETCEETN